MLRHAHSPWLLPASYQAFDFPTILWPLCACAVQLLHSHLLLGSEHWRHWDEHP